MGNIGQRSLSLWAVGSVLASLLCAHAISPNPHSLSQVEPEPLITPIPQPAPAYRHTFRILSLHPEITDRYDDIILREANKRHMDPQLIKAIIAAESEFSMEAISPRGARGLMQVLPITADEIKMSRQALDHAEGNIAAGTAYLELLYAIAWKRHKFHAMAYKDAPPWLVQRIVAAYNAGPKALRHDHWRRQTIGYVRNVLLFYRSDVSKLRPSIRARILGRLFPIL